MSSKQITIVDHVFVAGFGMYLTFFSVVCRVSTFQYHEHQPVHVKTLGRHQLVFSVFSDLYICCLLQQGLIISLWTANSLGHSLDCLGGFYRATMAKNSVRYNQIPMLRVSFSDERCLVGALSPTVFSSFPEHLKFRLLARFPILK